MAGIRSRANGWFTLTRKFTFKGHSPPTIFARIDRPVNALQLCRLGLQYSHKRNFVADFV